GLQCRGGLVWSRRNGRNGYPKASRPKTQFPSVSARPALGFLSRIRVVLASRGLHGDLRRLLRKKRFDTARQPGFIAFRPRSLASWLWPGSKPPPSLAVSR